MKAKRHDHRVSTSMARGLAAIALALGLAGTAAAQDFERPAFFRLRQIAYAGSGCPAGTSTALVMQNLTAFRLTFDSFLAEAGPGIPFSAKRKNCQVAVDFEMPSGWSYTIVDVTHRGYVDLDAGVSASHNSRYYFQGSATTASLSTQMRGPRTGDYTIQDTLGVSALVWSPCGYSRALNINTDVRLSSYGSGYGVVTVDSIDGYIARIYGLRYRRC